MVDLQTGSAAHHWTCDSLWCGLLRLITALDSFVLACEMVRLTPRVLSMIRVFPGTASAKSDGWFLSDELEASLT